MITLVKIITNPDREYVKEVKSRLKSNSGFCPCKLTKNKDTKCMCREFREQDSGMCGCGLYIKIDEEDEF